MWVDSTEKIDESSKKLTLDKQLFGNKGKHTGFQSRMRRRFDVIQARGGIRENQYSPASLYIDWGNRDRYKDLGAVKIRLAQEFPEKNNTFSIDVDNAVHCHITVRVTKCASYISVYGIWQNSRNDLMPFILLWYWYILQERYRHITSDTWYARILGSHT